MEKRTLYPADPKSNQYLRRYRTLFLTHKIHAFIISIDLCSVACELLFLYTSIIIASRIKMSLSHKTRVYENFQVVVMTIMISVDYVDTGCRVLYYTFISKYIAYDFNFTDVVMI